jgi:hypothetical protein
MAKDTKLLANATLNPVFSDMFGGMINNPLFISPSEARGLMDVTVVKCDRLPLASLVLKNAPQNDGRGEFLFSIREVYLGNSELLKGLEKAGQAGFARSLQGAIRDSQVTVAQGQTNQDVIFNVGESDRPFRIRGLTWLETKKIDLAVTLPPQLLRQLGSIGHQAAELFPEGIEIPVRGTSKAIQVPNVIELIATNVQKGLLPGLLRRATGGDRNDNRGAQPSRDPSMPKDDTRADTSKDPARPPATTEPPPGSDPIKDLFDLVGKQRQQKEKEKQDQRDRRKQERGQ